MMLRFLLLLPLFSIFFVTKAKQPPLHLDCDPCIRRHDFVIKAIVHGTSDDPFWLQAQAAMRQVALDMKVQLEMDLYNVFDPVKMAEDITAVTARIGDDVDRLDALIVTIPSSSVHEAIQQVVGVGLPVFGFNVGYDVFENLGILGFVAQHEYQAGARAAEEFIQLAAISSVGVPESFVDEGGLEAVSVNHTRIQKALFVNHQIGNEALKDRFLGFKDMLLRTYPSIMEHIRQSSNWK